MTIPRLNAMMAYWQKHPPVHLVVAGLAGYKPPENKTTNSDDDLSELINICQSFGGEIVRG